MICRPVFEINPILCPKCGVEMRPIAAVTSDKELPRLLENLGLPTDFPIITPPRSPPPIIDDESQLDPIVDAFDGIDEPGGGNCSQPSRLSP